MRCVPHAAPTARAIHMGTKIYIAACDQAGHAFTLDQWAIVRLSQTKNMVCTTCDTNLQRCRHVQEASGVVARESGPQADLQERFDTFFDLNTGKRKLTCESSHAIPEDISSSAYSDAYSGAQS